MAQPGTPTHGSYLRLEAPGTPPPPRGSMAPHAAPLPGHEGCGAAASACALALLACLRGLCGISGDDASVRCALGMHCGGSRRPAASFPALWQAAAARQALRSRPWIPIRRTPSSALAHALCPALAHSAPQTHERARQYRAPGVASPRRAASGSSSGDGDHEHGTLLPKVGPARLQRYGRGCRGACGRMHWARNQRPLDRAGMRSSLRSRPPDPPPSLLPGSLHTQRVVLEAAGASSSMAANAMELPRQRHGGVLRGAWTPPPEPGRSAAAPAAAQPGRACSPTPGGPSSSGRLAAEGGGAKGVAADGAAGSATGNRHARKLSREAMVAALAGSAAVAVSAAASTGTQGSGKGSGSGGADGGAAATTPLALLLGAVEQDEDDDVCPTCLEVYSEGAGRSGPREHRTLAAGNVARRARLRAAARALAQASPHAPVCAAHRQSQDMDGLWAPLSHAGAAGVLEAHQLTTSWHAMCWEPRRAPTSGARPHARCG